MATLTAMPSTTTYQPGDLVLVAFPFTGSAQNKNRPALVILDTGDADVVLARVTTQVYQTSHDVTITEWRGAGLAAASIVRTHKLAPIEKALIRRQVGSLTPADRQRVSAAMRLSYRNW
jgi:mRNA interferase MazF